MYRYQYSDYSTTTEGPPDPERWVGPPGPQGPPGATGPAGRPGDATGSVTATGTPVPRTLPDRFADAVNVRDFGAVFDGASHPLSAYYPTLAAAQAVYPKATALTNEIDGIAIQAALDFCAARAGAGHEYSFGGTVILPQGLGLQNTPLTINTSCVALASSGYGIGSRNNQGYSVVSAPTKLRWTGAAIAAGQSAVYQLTIRPSDGGRFLVGCNLRGILFECNGVAGCGGMLVKSLRESLLQFGVHEPRGVLYPGASLTSGSVNVTVSSTANIHFGETICSASLPLGSYVVSIIDGTTLKVSAAATATVTETVCIAGEGCRLDVEDGIQDSNSTCYNEIWYSGNSEQAAANAAGPLLVLAGSGLAGSGPGPSFSYGNTCINQFRYVRTVTSLNQAVVLNNSDHNRFDKVATSGIGGSAPNSIIINGSSDANNGGARYNWFDYIVGAQVRAVGTETFTGPSLGNRIDFLDRQNGATFSVGTGATLSVYADNIPTLQVQYNSSGGIVPYVPDSTVAGGNDRGVYSVDLQTSRTSPTQIAAGQQSVITGGTGNTASGTQSIVGSGSGNSATGLGASIIGGGSNVAGSSYTVASGFGANADIYGCRAHSNGLMASGRRAQQMVQLLRATSAANTTPVRLTADGAAAGSANVVNQLSSSLVQANSIRVQLIAIDSTNGTNRYSWTQTGLLARNGGVGTTVYVPGTPVILASGTTTGIAVADAADTANAGYSLTFTPPTGNTAIWRVVATVEWTRVDGA